MKGPWFCCLLTVVVISAIVGCVGATDQVCYGKYGCFTNNPPFNRPLIPLPQHPNEIGLTYHVTTRQDPSGEKRINDHDVSLLQASGYDGSKRTIIIVHGWIENHQAGWQTDLKKSLILKEDVNVIVAGWKEGAAEFYTISVANTRLVGSMITELIKFLNKNTQNTPASFHVIGFSLGGQIAGYIGQRLQKPKLGRITGLDPAAPYYFNAHTDVRLDPSDADFVDVIHTNAPLIGTLTKSGHLDFWPNSGMLQRGCKITSGIITEGVMVLACHHFRAPHFYVNSVLSQRSFKSYRCSSWSQFTRGRCMSCGDCPEMGHNAIKYKGMTDGNYYLYTNEERPFAVHRYALITFKTSSWIFSDGYNPRVRIYGSKGSTEKIKLALRHMPKGSSETFVAPIKSDLGTLQSIDVWHFPLNPLDGWRLDKVTVKYLDSHEVYTACYGNWIPLYLLPVNKKLAKGNSSC